ncbi:hypothetical protein D3C86_1894020 [compost metagenome]
MLASETLRERILFGVDDEIDLALAVQGDVLVAVAGDGGKAHALEQRAQGLRVRRRVFDELKTVGAHGVVPGFEFHVRLLAYFPPSIVLRG